MSKSRTVWTVMGLPLAAAVAFATAGCQPASDTTRTQSSPGAKASSAKATNGIEKLEGAEAFSRAIKATQSAGSVRLRGQVNDGADNIRLDFRYSGRNRSGGTLRIGPQKIELIRLGSVVYFKGNKAFLQEIGGKEAATAMSGKYVKTSSKDDPEFADLQAFTNLADFLKQFPVEGQGWKMGQLGNTGGKPSVVVTGLPGDRAHIAAQGTPYLLRLAEGQGTKNSIDFLSYNEPVDLKPPPAALVIDMSG